MSWDAEQICLDDQSQFETLNGLWTGKKPPFVTAGVIRNTNFTESGRVDYSDVAWLQVEQKQLAKRQIKPGDIIVERSGGGPKQPVGRVVYFERKDGPFSFSNFTSAIRVRDREVFDSKFIFYGLLELYQSGRTEDLQRHTTGIRNLDFTAYKERATFPQISIHEQRKIVAVLGMVQRAIGQQERLLALTAELKKTLLHQLFTQGLRGEPQKQTEIGLVPESWEVAKLGDIATSKSGGTPSRTKPEYWEGGSIQWVKTGEVDYCVINDTEEKITAAGLANSSAKIFPAGTLLMAMYGQGITRGKVAILGIEAATNQACVAIFPCEDVSTKFLYYFFEGKYEYIRNLGHGANQKNLSAEILKGVTVAYPKDREAQKSIVRSLEALDKKLSLHERKHTALTDLFRTLLHQLMTAQIRVHDLDLPELEIAGAGQ